ncbi:MAG: outer membrane protein assembly factor BamA [Bdellovibrionales bacterium]|nr:outer membrane protein assembly factor BamA [Bdellovibrionales bacterium]
MLTALVALGMSAERASAQTAQTAQNRPAVKSKPTASRATNKSPRKPAPRAAAKAPVSAAAPASAEATGPKIVKIVVKGNKKIESDAVLAKLANKQGQALTSERIRQDLELLFKTGFFYDVKVDREVVEGGVQLTYELVEKPSITEISVVGNNEIESDEINTAAGIKAYEVLNMGKIRDAVEKIQKLYEDKGYFLARVTPKVEPAGKDGRGDDAVKLVFEVQENDKVKVKRITILGNKQIPDGKIKGLLQTQEGGFFSFVSASGSYKQDAFDRDVQIVNYLYFNEGYVQVKVDRPQVYVTPDKKGIYITIRVEEGDRFKVGSVSFAGDLLFPRSELEEATEIDGKEWYEHETLLKDIRTVQAKYGDLGYAYANIIPRTRIREKDKEVDLTFEIDKGNKVYFGRINVVGNSKTRDKVVRRELMIREGELYNETRKRESMDNVKRLGYFDEVNFNSSTPNENQDLMNLDVVVKERNTGSIQVGAGYSTYSQFIFNGQVNQINLMGRGQRLGVSIDLSSNQSLFNLNFTEPYFLDTEWSVGFDAYQSKRTTTEYEETKKGGAVRVGYPITRFLRTFLRYKLEESEINLDEKVGDKDLFPVPNSTDPNPQGNPNGLTSSGTLTLEYDKRNDRYSPTKGVYASSSLEYAGLGGDQRFTKGVFTGRLYEKLFWDIVFRNNLTYGFIRSNDPDRDPPYNELFLLGGANSMRGYNWFSIAKRKFSNKVYNDSLAALGPDRARIRAMRPFGGTQQLFYQAEFEFPLISEAGIKGVVFYDIGNADDVLSATEFRSDVGFGFRWFSPIGPLRFEWGFPLERKPELEEPAVVFQFAIGSPF